jgi:hypothetical protein
MHSIDNKYEDDCEVAHQQINFKLYPWIFIYMNNQTKLMNKEKIQIEDSYALTSIALEFF